MELVTSVCSNRAMLYRSRHIWFRPISYPMVQYVVIEWLLIASSLAGLEWEHMVFLLQ